MIETEKYDLDENEKYDLDIMQTLDHLDHPPPPK